jgi:hypothetical protein
MTAAVSSRPSGLISQRRHGLEVEGRRIIG